jgi:hypothetical protein
LTNAKRIAVVLGGMLAYRILLASRDGSRCLNLNEISGNPTDPDGFGQVRLSARARFDNGGFVYRSR